MTRHLLKIILNYYYHWIRLLFWYFSEVPALFIKSKNFISNCLFSEFTTSLWMLLIVVDSLTVVFHEPPSFLYAYCIDKTCIWTRIHNGPVGSWTRDSRISSIIVKSPVLYLAELRAHKVITIQCSVYYSL